MSSAFLDISATLDSHLNNMPDLPPVAWENFYFELVTGTLYLRPVNLRGETYAKTGKDITEGIYHINVFSEAGQGREEATVVADLIATHFKPDTEMTYNGVTVRIESVSAYAGFSDGGAWYQLPVIINYYAFTTRR